MHPFLDSFIGVVKNNRSLFEKNQVNSFTGWWLDCAVIKLQKKEWSSPALHENPIHAGIFFSIWIGEKERQQAIVHYNIHALQLRKLEGYRIKSREFADDFRQAFAAGRHAWQNVSVDYGPLTLMEGHIPLVRESLEKDVDGLVKKFIPLCAIIDNLLEARKK